MKICINCGNKLNDQDKKCPVCKSKAKDAIRVDENNQERIAEVIESVKTKNSGGNQVKKKPKGCLVSLLGVIAFIVIMAILNLGNITSTLAPENDQRLTLEKYNQIENGMTYDEVFEIIGFTVSPEAEVGEKGTAFYTVSFRYMGDDQVKGSLGANASFMFQGGKLNTKAQVGLK